MYEEEYIKTRDIDWFGVINGRYIHVASCGGMLPSEVMNKKYLRDLQYEVAMLEDVRNGDGGQIVIMHNDQYLLERFSMYEDSAAAIENYKRSFDTFAMKGFWSFDKEKINNPDDSHYRLISWPTTEVKPLLKSDMRYKKVTENVDFDNPMELESIDWLAL